MKRILPLCLALLLAACGVRPTDGVIPAGPAPAFPQRNQAELVLYFVLDGSLYQISRPTPGVASPESALRALIGGPNPDERARGLTTLLPGDTEVTYTDQLTVVLPVALGELPEAALNQLSCTTVTSGIWGPLRVTGADGSREVFGCPAS